jgi:hypothetical protein
MNNYLNKHKRTITRQILAVFVLSWFSLIGQATAHTFMMAEIEQHKAMGHDMGAHCQPVLCETVISLDDQTGYGLSSVSVIDFNDLAVLQVSTVSLVQLTNHYQRPRQFSAAEFDPPPLQRTGILRV